MATAAKTASAKAPQGARGPAGKGPPGKGGFAAKGKAPPEAKAEPPPPAPSPRLKRLKLFIFVALGVAMLATLGVAGWAVLIREPDPVYVDIPPPSLAPPRPTGPVVREGDLRDELWKHMGVRPQGE
ncbi:MAG: hypothetical protein GC202_11410 [Alphaproteobacteria bacterium]|nr:hypothetical protein [Alphaproteobacteria bacterium]